MKKRTLALAMILTMAAVTGCGGQETSKEQLNTEVAENTSAEQTSGTSQEGEQISTEKTDLVVAIDREPQALDPTGSNHSIARVIVSQMMEPLLKFDEDMNVTLCLAESYEQLDDTTYKFTLPKGVKFHNGEELTAKDVVFSFKRASETPIGGTYTDKLDLEATETPDDYTVIFKMKEPYAAMERVFCLSYLAIVNEKAVNDVGEDTFARNPVGTGPFKFEQWTAGDNLSIVKNDEYHGEKALLDRVTYRFITEQTSRTIEMESGGVDMALVIPSSDYERLESNPDIELDLYTSLYVRYIAFNVQQDALKDARVRQALNYATDIDTIVDVLYTEKGAQVSTGPVPPGVAGKNESLIPYGYDPEKAKELLAEAGYEDGLDLTFTALGNSTNNMMGQMLQEQWKQVGVNLTLNPMESGALSEYANGMEQEVMPVRTAFSIADIGDGLEYVYHSKAQGTSRIISANPELDALLDEAAVTMDNEKRDEMYQDAQQIIHDEAYQIDLCYEYSSIAHSNKMRGLTALPTEDIDFSKIYFVD